MLPTFERDQSGKLILQTKAGSSYKVPHGVCNYALSHEVVLARARKEVQVKGGSAHSEVEVWGHARCQFGRYRGSTFLWMLENCLGYAAYLAHSIRNEPQNPAPISNNKFLLRKYLLLFPEGREALQKKTEEKKVKSGIPLVNTPPELSDRELAEAADRVEASYLASSSQPPPSSSSAPIMASPPSPVPQQVVPLVQPLSALLSGKQDQFPLPEGWRTTLPVADHKWVSRRLFRWNIHGKAELDSQRLDQLWYYPPQPSLHCPQPPHPDLYFARKLLVWMPKKLWRCRLVCPKAECGQHELHSAGLYRKVRQVLDVDGYYSVAAEYLQCSCCKGKLISWSQPILSQLSVSLQQKFPIILTYRYACDMKVVRMMRQRGLGNGPAQLFTTLREQHQEQWLAQTASYLEDRKPFAGGVCSTSPPEEPPAMPDVPTHQWLQTVYVQDVSQRLSGVQAAITSTFGSILKIDSTKKITRKLAGKSTGTAAWASNVGNEHGQVLMSVFTSHEGLGLDAMFKGLQTRYADADVTPPALLYVDRDCCNGRTAQMLQPAWSTTQVRLDIWHFMRRLASAVTSESHQLYKALMQRISQAIFAWDQGDFEALKNAKRSQMQAEGIENPSDSDVLQRLSRREFALHCRRTTRGVEKTTRLLEAIFHTFTGEQGRDTLGVPLLNSTQAWQTWEEQKCHVTCIQDPADVSLYTQTGTLSKGGKLLPTFRCARGSTSLESFHLHLNRFIPGNSVNDIHCQAYLIEGLARWNKDRSTAAVKAEKEPLGCYTGRLQHGVNMLSKAVLNRALIPGYEVPRPYTGERIGMEYLLHQGSASHAKLLDSTSFQEPNNKLDEAEYDEGFLDCSEEVDDTVYPPAEIDHPGHASMEHNMPSQRVRHPSADQPAAGPDFTFEDLFTGPVDLPPETSLGPSEGHPTTAAGELDVSVGPRNIPGYERVQRLAQYLANLRHHDALSSREATSVVRLYNDLSDYDKLPTTFEKRYKEVEVRGRFKAAKGTSVTPGVVSTRRCFLSTNQGPANVPDCNRIVESLTKRLCLVNPGDRTMQGKRLRRWSLILRDYSTIRSLVLNNATITEGTRLQLPDLNQATLLRWFNKLVKGMERKVLEQGLRYQPPAPTATHPVPAPKQPPVSLVMGNEARHQFALPESTVGLASKCRKKAATPVQPLPTIVTTPLPYAVLLPAATTQPATSVTVVTPPAPSSFVPQPPAEDVPRSTMWYRKRRLAMKEEGQPINLYKRRKVVVCSLCDKERLAATHKQYYGAWWCQETSTVPYQEWLEDRRKKRKDAVAAATAPPASSSPPIQ